MKVMLANPRGFCAGVDRAIAIVEGVLKKHGKPIYVRNEVVHNKYVVDILKQKGAVFVNNLAKIPSDSVIIFSAHGVSKQVQKQAQLITDKIYDATCPLVTKVHKEVINKQKQNYQVILIGHANHPEVEGTLGQSIAGKNMQLVENEQDVDKLNLDNNKNISYTTQTTLSVDDTKKIVTKLKLKFPHIKAPKKDDICYATQNRQDAIKNLMSSADVLLVLGSSNSSNSNRLKEIAKKMGKEAYLIDSAKKIKDNWVDNIKTIAVTAGASAPEVLVQEVISYLKNKNASNVVEISGVIENTCFPLPKELI